MNPAFKFCPRCAAPLQLARHGDGDRLGCIAQGCGYVHWDNPTPVVAAIVEHEGAIILARNRAWPMKLYGLITGFLEKEDLSPDDAVRREVKEELSLDATGATFVGHYAFQRMNQIIIAYHVPATGEIALSEELADFKRVEPGKARYWPAGTGHALRDWLRMRGFDPQPMDFPT